MLITRGIRMSQKMADLKNNIDEKLDAVKKELEKYRKKILDDPKYFFIPALIASLLSLLVISVLVLTDRNPLEKFNYGATTDLERRLQDTQEALETMLGRFKEVIMEEFGDQYGYGFNKVAIFSMFSIFSIININIL